MSTDTEPTTPAIDFSDTRGGTFVVLDGARVHADDITDADLRTRLGLPALPSSTDSTTSEPS